MKTTLQNIFSTLIGTNIVQYPKYT